MWLSVKVASGQASQYGRDQQDQLDSRWFEADAKMIFLLLGWFCAAGMRIADLQETVIFIWAILTPWGHPHGWGWWYRRQSVTPLGSWTAMPDSAQEHVLGSHAADGAPVQELWALGHCHLWPDTWLHTCTGGGWGSWHCVQLVSVVSEHQPWSQSSFLQGKKIVVLTFQEIPKGKVLKIKWVGLCPTHSWEINDFVC